MKKRNYENNILILFLAIILFIFEIIFILILFLKKEYNYIKLTGIVMKDNILIVVVSKNEKTYFHNNSFLYLEGKKKRFKIIEDRGAIMSHNKKKYHELLINVDFNKKYKANDTISLSIKTKKKRLIEIFKIIGEGG